LDGGLKIAQDAICTALEVNDNRVVDIHLVKRIDPLNPRIEIELEVLDDWSFEYEHEVLVR
ncbi:MAG: RusA family crossover junction endodeoxyribonuclease, partial [Roseiflexaceae bacterium]